MKGPTPFGPKRVAFLAFLLATAAQGPLGDRPGGGWFSRSFAQAPSPAQIGVSATPPQSLFWLDSTKTWQSFNPWLISNVAGYLPNSVSIGVSNPNALPMAFPAAIEVGANLYPGAPPALHQSGSMNMGLDIITNPGNLPYDANSYHYWNYIQPNIDTYWSTPTFIRTNVGMFVDTRTNNAPTQPNQNVNGSTRGFMARATLNYPTDPSYVAAGVTHELIGAALEANAPRTDGGTQTTVGVAGIVTDTTLHVGSTAGWVNGDNLKVALNGGKYQNFSAITVVDGTTVTSATTPLQGAVSLGNPVYNAKGQIFAHSGFASAGSLASGVVGALVDTEEDLAAYAGTPVMYKANLTLISAAGDAVQGTIYDAAIAVSQSSASSSPGIRDAILFCNCNSVWPIAANGGLMKVDGHNPLPQAMGYGIDMSWATISATGGSNGYAFAFSTTGNGVPDNYWRNAGLQVSGTLAVTGQISGNGGIKVQGVPASAGAGGLTLCIDSAGVIYKKATCP